MDSHLFPLDGNDKDLGKALATPDIQEESPVRGIFCLPSAPSSKTPPISRCGRIQTKIRMMDHMLDEGDMVLRCSGKHWNTLSAALDFNFLQQTVRPVETRAQPQQSLCDWIVQPLYHLESADAHLWPSVTFEQFGLATPSQWKSSSSTGSRPMDRSGTYPEGTRGRKGTEPLPWANRNLVYLHTIKAYILTITYLLAYTLPVLRHYAGRQSAEVRRTSKSTRRSEMGSGRHWCPPATSTGLRCSPGSSSTTAFQSHPGPVRWPPRGNKQPGSCRREGRLYSERRDQKVRGRHRGRLKPLSRLSSTISRHSYTT